MLRLSSTPVVSIAKVRGRTRGIGNEFVLACDMRFASRQNALFGNPEIGVGLIPGGGALEWLPRVVGRSRALEIVLSGDDFDADIAERYGWVNRTLDDNDIDSFVDALAGRLASFDREVLAAAKAQINRFGTPTAAELQSSNDMFFSIAGLAECAGAPCQDPRYRLRRSERLRIELRPVPSFVRAGGRQWHGHAARLTLTLYRRCATLRAPIRTSRQHRLGVAGAGTRSGPFGRHPFREKIRARRCRRCRKASAGENLNLCRPENRIDGLMSEVLTRSIC